MIQMSNKAKIPLALQEYLLKFFYFSHLLSKIEQPKIATLGPEGTSSETAADYLCLSFDIKDRQICLFSTYEEAFASIVNKENDLFLVANAYDKVNTFYMSPLSQLEFSFVFSTPPYGLAKKPGTYLPTDRKIRVATHPAPACLTPYFLEGRNTEVDLFMVRSTSEAAQKAHDLESDLCITNAVAASKYGLDIISPTYVIEMLWSIFCRKE